MYLKIYVSYASTKTIVRKSYFIIYGQCSNILIQSTAKVLSNKIVMFYYLIVVILTDIISFQYE